MTLTSGRPPVMHSPRGDTLEAPHRYAAPAVSCHVGVQACRGEEQQAIMISRGGKEVSPLMHKEERRGKECSHAGDSRRRGGGGGDWKEGEAALPGTVTLRGSVLLALFPTS